MAERSNRAKGQEQGFTFSTSTVPVAVVNGGGERFLKLYYFDTVAYAILRRLLSSAEWAGARPSRKCRETSIGYSNGSCGMSKAAARPPAMKTDTQSVPRKDWEFAFQSGQNEKSGLAF